MCNLSRFLLYTAYGILVTNALRSDPLLSFGFHFYFYKSHVAVDGRGLILYEQRRPLLALFISTGNDHKECKCVRQKRKEIESRVIYLNYGRIHDVEVTVFLGRSQRIAQKDGGSYELAVAKRFDGRLPDADRMLDGALPVGVLVDERQENLRLVEAISVGHEGPQQQVAFHAVQPLLHRRFRELERRFESGHSKQAIVSRPAVVASLPRTSRRRRRRRAEMLQLLLAAYHDAVDTRTENRAELTEDARTGDLCRRLFDPIQWRVSQAVEYRLGITSIADQVDAIGRLGHLKCHVVSVADERPRGQCRAGHHDASME